MAKKLLAAGGYDLNGSPVANRQYVDDNAQYYPLGTGYGIPVISGDPILFSQSFTTANGTAAYTRLWVPAGMALTRMWVAVRTAGTYVTEANGNTMSVYSDAGTLLDSTAVDNTVWTVVGWRSIALAVGVAASTTGRFVYHSYIANGMTGGQVAANATSDNISSFVSAGNGVTNRRGFRTTSTTTPPSTITPTTGGTSAGVIALVGIS